MITSTEFVYGYGLLVLLVCSGLLIYLYRGKKKIDVRSINMGLEKSRVENIDNPEPPVEDTRQKVFIHTCTISMVSGVQCEYQYATTKKIPEELDTFLFNSFYEYEHTPEEHTVGEITTTGRTHFNRVNISSMSIKINEERFMSPHFDLLTDSLFEEIVGIARSLYEAYNRTYCIDPKQEPKYDCDKLGIFNRHSGQYIPKDEPVFLFRAKDQHALQALVYYSTLCTDQKHKEVVTSRINQFREWAERSPQKLGEPTSHTSLPREGMCEHNKGLTEYCEPCGRINNGN